MPLRMRAWWPYTPFPCRFSSFPAAPMSIHTSEVPRAVRIAALLFALYGLMVVGNAFVLQSSAEWANAREFPRALLRLAGCAAVAYGLMRGQRWEWWIASVLGTLWVVTSAIALLLLGDAGLDQVPPSTPVFLVVVVAVMGTAVALLQQPASRAAFR